MGQQDEAARLGAYERATECGMIACKMTEGCLALDGSTLGLLERAEPRAPILRGSVGGRGGAPVLAGLGAWVEASGSLGWMPGWEVKKLVSREQRAATGDGAMRAPLRGKRYQSQSPPRWPVLHAENPPPSLPFPCLQVHYTSVRTFLRYDLPNGGLPQAPMAAGGSQTKPPSFTSRFPISPTRWATATVLAADTSSRNASPTADRQRPNGEARGGGDGQTHTG